jgi:crotonobetainyl-CoA:carnitine CoA-transferase CaiB-like acyl-CoA transferase
MIAMPDANGPLSGVKVVACSTAQAGTVPYMLMADLGAEVVKIEVPGSGVKVAACFPVFRAPCSRPAIAA